MEPNQRLYLIESLRESISARSSHEEICGTKFKSQTVDRVIRVVNRCFCQTLRSWSSRASAKADGSSIFQRQLAPIVSFKSQTNCGQFSVSFIIILTENESEKAHVAWTTIHQFCLVREWNSCSARGGAYKLALFHTIFVNFGSLYSGRDNESNCWGEGKFWKHSFLNLRNSLCLYFFF